MLVEHDVYITGLAQCARRAFVDGPFSFDSYTAHLIRFLGEDRAGRAYGGGVPALRERAGRRERDGNGQSPGAAALDDLDGRADRHPRQSDQSE